MFKIKIYFYSHKKKGLFQRAIAESGSVLAEWALDRDGRGKAASLQIAEIAGCPVTPYAQLLDCVRNVDPAVLTDAYQQYSVRFNNIKCKLFNLFI